MNTLTAEASIDTPAQKTLPKSDCPATTLPSALHPPPALTEDFIYQRYQHFVNQFQPDQPAALSAQAWRESYALREQYLDGRRSTSFFSSRSTTPLSYNNDGRPDLGAKPLASLMLIGLRLANRLLWVGIWTAIVRKQSSTQPLPIEEAAAPVQVEPSKEQVVAHFDELTDVANSLFAGPSDGTDTSELRLAYLEWVIGVRKLVRPDYRTVLAAHAHARVLLNGLPPPPLQPPPDPILIVPKNTKPDERLGSVVLELLSWTQHTYTTAIKKGGDTDSITELQFADFLYDALLHFRPVEHLARSFLLDLSSSMRSNLLNRLATHGLATHWLYHQLLAIQFEQAHSAATIQSALSHLTITNPPFSVRQLTTIISRLTALVPNHTNNNTDDDDHRYLLLAFDLFIAHVANGKEVDVVLLNVVARAVTRRKAVKAVSGSYHLHLVRAILWASQRSMKPSLSIAVGSEKETMVGVEETGVQHDLITGASSMGEEPAVLEGMAQSMKPLAVAGVFSTDYKYGPALPSSKAPWAYWVVALAWKLWRSSVERGQWTLAKSLYLLIAHQGQLRSDDSTPSTARTRAHERYISRRQMPDLLFRRFLAQSLQPEEVRLDPAFPAKLWIDFSRLGRNPPTSLRPAFIRYLGNCLLTVRTKRLLSEGHLTLTTAEAELLLHTAYRTGFIIPSIRMLAAVVADTTEALPLATVYNPLLALIASSYSNHGRLLRRIAARMPYHPDADSYLFLLRSYSRRRRLTTLGMTHLVDLRTQMQTNGIQADDRHEAELVHAFTTRGALSIALRRFVARRRSEESSCSRL